ncbi:hypothetical protein HPB50_028537 [Hyalomma asiaticum]|nr:hypothetical protein HPB50_028537 [Hyalomma asiaticum]
MLTLSEWLCDFDHYFEIRRAVRVWRLELSSGARWAWRGDLDLSIDANTAAGGVGVGEETEVVPGLQYPGTLSRCKVVHEGKFTCHEAHLSPLSPPGILKGIPGGLPVLEIWTPEVASAELRAGACGDGATPGWTPT